MKHFKDDDKAGVFLIWLVAAAMVSLFLLVTEAESAQTMHLVDSYVDGGQRVCVYSDGRDYAYTYRARGSQCPYTHIEY
ncbi:TPA: hypothetical protein ACJIOU_004864 [Escherichia coli]